MSDRTFYIANCLERIVQAALRLPVKEWRGTFEEIARCIEHENPVLVHAELQTLLRDYEKRKVEDLRSQISERKGV